MTDKEIMERSFTVCQGSGDFKPNSYDQGKTDKVSVLLADDEDSVVICASVDVKGGRIPREFDDNDILFTYGDPDGEVVSPEASAKLLEDAHPSFALRDFCVQEGLAE